MLNVLVSVQKEDLLECTTPFPEIFCFAQPLDKYFGKIAQTVACILKIQ